MDENSGSGSPFIVEARDLSITYGDGHQAVRHFSLGFHAQTVTAIIGPSGCGKSTVLRAINRMNELIPNTRTEGEVWYRGKNIYDPATDPVEIRRHIGMVFQKPNPFPKSVYHNIAWAPKIHGYTGDLDELVETSLRKAALWDEVKDKLKKNALALSGGQQQRLCIARAIALQPDVILMDEPTSALDPIASSYIEDLITELQKDYTIIIVTHNMQQAGRISAYTVFMLMGELVEAGPTRQVFVSPKDERTERYLTGRFG
ncbi:MAG: phosphate ABC transporter ATP-binding protein PstB [Rectinema sp.]|nr:phosphate ABC transporter ATP-binding protein PstB [Rectinema sp.]